MGSLTAVIDVCDGLRHVGLGRYCELFRRLEIGRPLCELCNEQREIWEELWQDPQGLGRVSSEDRSQMVDQMPAILDFCAQARAQEKAETELAAKYLAGPQAVRALPNARGDGRVALWLEKKSPARTKGWQPRWFVFCPYTAHVYYFEEEEDEDLENREDKRWLSFALVTRITSNNFASGHFEFHTKARSMELRVPSKTEADLQPIRQLVAALKELGAFPVETLGTIEPASTAHKDAAADVKRKEKAAEEAATKAAKLSASPGYLAAVGMSFGGLERGTWLKVLKSAEVSAAQDLSRKASAKVGQLEEGEQLRVLEVKKTEPGGFTKVRFDNGTLKGWVDIVTWDCDVLMEMMDEQQLRDAWRVFETTLSPRAGKLKGSRDGAAEQVVRCGYSTNSPRLDDLLDGEEIEVFESIVDPVTNIPRVRFKIERHGTPQLPPLNLPGWVSAQNANGDPILEKRPGPSVPLPSERVGAAYLRGYVPVENGRLNRHHSSVNHGCLKMSCCPCTVDQDDRAVPREEEPCPWKRWFVISRCGKVHYYAQQADEQAHGIAKDNGEPSGERLKGEFSLRDCIRFSTPKRELSILVCNHQPMFDPAVATFSPISTVYLDPRESGVFELHLQTKTLLAGLTKIEPKKLTLRVEDRTFEGNLSRLESLNRLEEIFGIICTNGGLATGNDGSILAGDAATSSSPEEAVPPATGLHAKALPHRVAPALPSSTTGTEPKIPAGGGLLFATAGLPHEQTATVPLPGARPGDGAVELWLEKKSPSVIKGWQRRWFVLHPSGEVFYFTDPSKEKTIGGKAKETKQQFSLSECQRFTSENKQQGLFDLHFAKTGKVMQLRVPEHTAVALSEVQNVLTRMKLNGVLSADNDGLIKGPSDDSVPLGEAGQQAELCPPPPAWSAAAQTQGSVPDSGSMMHPQTVPPSAANPPDVATAASLAAQWQQMQADDDDV